MHTIAESPQGPDGGFGALFDRHASVLLLIDPHTGAIRYANHAAGRFYGYTVAELCTMRIAQLDAADPAQQARLHQRALRSEQNRFELQHRAAGGDLRTVEVDLSPVTLGGQALLCAVVHNVTERARAEQALRQSELRYRTLIDALNVSVCRWLPDTTLVFANETYRAIFGIIGDPIGQKWLQFLPESARAETTAFCRALIANPTTATYEHPVTSRDGQVRHFQWIDTPIFDADRRLIEFQSVGIDVTERRQAEEIGYAQRDLARIVSTAASSAAAWAQCLAIAIRLSGMDCGGIYLFDPEQRELQIVEQAGLSAEFVAQTARYPLEAPNVQMILLGTSFYFGAEELQAMPYITAEGLQAAASVPIHYQGRVFGCINLASHTLPQVSPFIRRALEVIAPEIGNIIVYLRTEEDLRESRLRIELALKGADMGMWDWYVQTGRTVFNERWASMLGYTLAELEPISIQTWITLCHPADLACSNKLLEQHFAGQSPLYECEARLRHKDGHWIWVVDRGRVVERDAEGRPVRMSGTHLDITERKQAEQALRELNQTLEERVRQRTAEVQDLYENAPVGYHALDANGTVLMVNQTQLRWLGYAREEIIGHSAVGVLAPNSIARFVAQLQNLKERGSVRDLEFEMVRKDGTIIPVLLSATAVYDERGEFVMSRSTVFDNSERKRAEIALRESEEQSRLLFEESPDAVVLFGEDGVVLQLNRAFEQLSGLSAAQLLGQTLDSAGLVPQAAVAQLAEEVIQHIKANANFAAVELRLRRANGESRDVGVRIFGLQIRGKRHYLTTMRDITTEKQAEETLRRANAELARAGRAKDEFLANMSHELRTPLNAILGLSETLYEGIYGPLTERQQGSVRNIEASGRHLLALINDILDLSKIEAGQLDLQVEAVVVADVCQSSMLFVREQALKKSLRLAFTLNDQMAVMEADPRRLKQLLVNLLSNAVKFTPPRGQVRLEVDVDAEEQVIRFAVRDTGIGIAADDLPRLFQPFRQLDSSLSRQHEGTGLGLALVRRLAELHGGSVVVESAPGQGSCFTVSLPYHTPQPSGGAAGAPGADRAGPITPLHSALVVEDSESAAEQLARYLHEASVRVFVHRQGAGALDQAIRLQPNLIFLDLQMPDRSGWDVLAQLKAHPRTRDIPVVIVSVIDDRPRGLAAGATEYIVKPISRGILQRVLHTVASAIDHETRQALVIAPRPVAPPDSARILLVEDNEVNIVTISDYLHARGYALSVARNGKEALSLVGQAQPALILMDIQMPEMDGLEATRRLRALPAYARVPIIALTALAMPGDRERCMQAGANEYLTKPVSLRGLAETIAALLRQ